MKDIAYSDDPGYSELPVHEGLATDNGVGYGLFVLALLVGLAAAALHAIYVLLCGLGQPLLDMHAFRQTQTALSVYWMPGGPWFAYETPVLGAPWAIPFEFPIYHWTVAFFSWTGVPLDQAGRLVSFAFYFATLGPLFLIFRVYELGRAAFLSTAILFLTAPLYLYWSRAFLVESCTLFFSCLALALLATYLRRRQVIFAVTAILAGCAAVLSKATTFPAFGLIGGCFLLGDTANRLRGKKLFPTLVSVIIPAMVLTIPFAVGYAWVVYSDGVKSENEFGRLLTSTSLSRWNFGTAEQRLSSALWYDTIRNRVLPDLFGMCTTVAFLALGAALARPRYAAAMLLAMIGFFTSFLLFTNLHIVHNYYQYANGLFALAAVGIGLASIAEVHRPLHYVAAGVMLVLLVLGQTLHFRRVFEPWLLRDYSGDTIFNIARLARERLPANAGIIVIGNDWSSIFPYYSQRKSLLLPGWTPLPLFSKVVKAPKSYFGERSFGGIVYCGDRLVEYPQTSVLISQFVARREVLAEYGGCQLLSPDQK